ncbi:hypothetical protein AXG93_2615s1200 [Marchantia polymorpha subsp. ruderalis]|uniref:Polyphenol oxidase C-terminal domain-containing protein n=1 Tax=Marchantia polymorpha subsp. ruderalis TaxID=1480154 RepID=A0A176WF13_MARPO|nr:hypothetical protein AXG93_2615s1200 [Marchantia polymorpha subsp. ruderalis]
MATETRVPVSSSQTLKRIPQSLLRGRESSGSNSALKISQTIKWVVYICAFVFCLQALLGTVDADPVLASSLGFCKNVTVLKGAPLHCCLPAPKRTPIRFRFPRIPRTLLGRPILRERKPAHIVQRDPDYVRNFRLDRRAPTSEDAREKGVKNVDQLQEDVVLERVKIPHLQYARFDVFINYPAANRQTRLYMSEYVGTFTHLPSGMVDMSRSVSESSSESEDNFRIVTIRYSVNAALKRLGITDYNADIVVTIVSKGARNSSPKTGFTFSNLIQDFQ